MRKLIFLSTWVVVALGCGPEPKVDEEGLTKAIRDLVPDSILASMKKQGMAINGGATPPCIVGTYRAAPFNLIGSNRSTDRIGSEFQDYQVTFHHQNNDSLTIRVDYVNGPESGKGLGSMIVGEGNKFSVFVRLDSKHKGGSRAVMTHVISGELSADGQVPQANAGFTGGGEGDGTSCKGVHGLRMANYMLDNNGNKGKIWIANGDGRVFNDADGCSSRPTPKDKSWFSSGAWLTNLPDCPCSYDMVKSNPETTCPKGKWCWNDEICTRWGDFHFGAISEARWIPADDDDAPGQQCTYDAQGQLITAGLAAGSPDRDAPGGCNCYNLLDRDGGHVELDVDTWESKKKCLDYLKEWPANQGACAVPHSVNTIDHISVLVKKMTCKEVVELLKAAQGSEAISQVLKEHLLGINTTELNTNAKLRVELNDWLDREVCKDDFNTTLCKRLRKVAQGLR